MGVGPLDTRYAKMAEALGCYAEYVEEPEDHPRDPALPRD
jgi:hypothetical protein